VRASGPRAGVARAARAWSSACASQGIRDERVLAAMQAVPSHFRRRGAGAFSAYDDTALPIGFQQTISQPFVVARMIELLRSGRELGQNARGRRRLRLPGGGAVAAGDRGLCGGAHPRRCSTSARANLRQLRCRTCG
jgi:hypothetical protein